MLNARTVTSGRMVAWPTLRRLWHQRSAQMAVVEVVCPDGAGEGMMIDVNLGDAGVVQVEVPAGVGPGMPFNIEIADPPPRWRWLDNGDEVRGRRQRRL